MEGHKFGGLRRRLSRAAKGAVVLMVTFILLNGVEVAVTGAEHDSFVWWAQIWIPGIVGVATLVSTFVALWISHRATLLAKAVEDQRQAAEETRDRREEKARLQLMAIDEARALTRWVNVAARDSFWENRELAKVGESRHGPTLLAEARVLLQQSLVPTAQELFEVTELEVRGLRRRLPDALYMPDRVLNTGGLSATSELIRDVIAYRRDRTLDRIRGWALDPDGWAQEILDDLSTAESDPDFFWDYRVGLGAMADLPPLSDLPKPPSGAAAREAFLRERGLLAES